MLVDDLQQKLNSEYKLNMSNFKKQVEKLVTILKTMVENNLNDLPIQ